MGYKGDSWGRCAAPRSSHLKTSVLDAADPDLDVSFDGQRDRPRSSASASLASTMGSQFLHDQMLQYAGGYDCLCKHTAAAGDYIAVVDAAGTWVRDLNPQQVASSEYRKRGFPCN